MDLASLGKAESIPKQVDKDNEIFFADESSSFNIATILCWIAAAIAIASCVFLFLIKTSASQKLETKQSEYQTTLSAINSADLSTVEQKASSFKSSVSELVRADAARYKMSKFLPLFYQKINSNVTLSNIVLGSKGVMTIDGKTDTYKSVAQQSETLRSWTISPGENVLKNVQIISVSNSNSAGGTSGVSFSITATLNKTASLTVKSADNGASSTTGSTSTESNSSSTLPEGGSDATVQ